MKWLLDVLAEHEQLDLREPFDRELLAEAILESLPKSVVVGAIASSAGAVLGVYSAPGAPDISVSDMAREIGNNATQTVLALLLAGPDPDNELAIPEVLE